MEILHRLEASIDELIDRKSALEVECRELRQQLQELESSKAAVLGEVEKILAKIEAHRDRGETP